MAKHSSLKKKCGELLSIVIKGSKAEFAAMTTHQRNQYELSLKHYWDMLSEKDFIMVNSKQVNSYPNHDYPLAAAV